MRRSTLARAVAAALATIAAAQALAGPQEDLAACGAITDATERLACYDRLAGRPVAPAPAPVAQKPASVALPAAPSAPAAAPSPAAASAPPAAPAPAGAAAKPAAPAADARSFGAYSVEHPAPPPVPEALTVRVIKLGKTIDGRPTMTLEGGALWLLDEKDPLLAVGDTVAISRGLLGSFLMETPTKRLHHVRRIQ